MAITTAATELNRLLDFLQHFSSRFFLTLIELIALNLLLVSQALIFLYQFLELYTSLSAAAMPHAMPSAMRREWSMSRLPRN